VARESFRRKLECLGWKPFVGVQRPDGRWWQAATSCGHTIIALADTRREAWSTACAMALTFILDEIIHVLPQAAVEFVADETRDSGSMTMINRVKRRLISGLKGGH